MNTDKHRSKRCVTFSIVLNELISRCYRVYLKETLEAWPFLCIHAITAFAHPCAADALFPPTPYMDVLVLRKAGRRKRPGTYLRRFPVDIPDNSDAPHVLNSYKDVKLSVCICVYLWLKSPLISLRSLPARSLPCRCVFQVLRNHRRNAASPGHRGGIYRGGSGSA